MAGGPLLSTSPQGPLRATRARAGAGRGYRGWRAGEGGAGMCGSMRSVRGARPAAHCGPARQFDTKEEQEQKRGKERQRKEKERYISMFAVKSQHHYDDNAKGTTDWFVGVGRHRPWTWSEPCCACCSWPAAAAPARAAPSVGAGWSGMHKLRNMIDR